jgi:hypothetical protein
LQICGAGRWWSQPGPLWRVYQRGTQAGFFALPLISLAGGPRPGAQPPLEALFNLVLELAIASSPSGSSLEALRWPTRLNIRRYGEHIELLPLRSRRSAPGGCRRAWRWCSSTGWLFYSLLLGSFL